MAATITLTIAEVPTQPINGLVVSKGGLNFAFANPGQTLFYNSGGPGSVTFVQDPSIQGSPSPFSIAFSSPVSSIQFGMVGLSLTLIPLATVQLFNASSVPFATLPLNATLADPFAEGLFSFSGGAVTNIAITPNTNPVRLAFDNLTVVTPSAVPEPSSLLLMAAGLALVALKIERRRSIS